MSDWRYHARRVLTGEWLHRDVPLAREELRWDLSGPGALRGTVAPDVGLLRASDGSLVLDEWGTEVYAEADDEIRWGGIVVKSGFEGASWKVEAAGFATYPHGVPFLDRIKSDSIDPADAFRQIWDHVQAQPDGDLGVAVDDLSTPVRLGTAKEPYDLPWWEAKDCGQELDSLAKEAPFDYVESHSWNGEDVDHRVHLAYPRLGRKRTDLAFVQPDNVVNPLVIERDGDDYANEVIGLGKGEGRKTVRTRISQRDGRLRRPAVFSDKSIGSKDRLRAFTRDDLEARRLGLEIAEVEVLDHPNARIGSWSLGDDVLIQATVPWLGDVALWHRVVSWALVSDTRAKLTLARSDRFRYGRAD